MGWLYTQSLGPHAGPRAYLDAQLTYDTPNRRCRVLRSALVRVRTYYAALEITRSQGERQVTAIVCLVRYNPRARDGHPFGYKDMDERMGPHEAECPSAILDLLTPTANTAALAWRARCRANIERRRAQSAKPMPRPGQVIHLDEALTFADGRTLSRFEVVAHPRSHRTVLFRDPVERGLYRIPNVKGRAYRLTSSATEQLGQEDRAMPDLPERDASP